MQLKQALAIASGFVTTEGPMACATLAPGFVQATNGDTGVRIPCSGLEVAITVDCMAARRMVGAIGSDPELAVKRNKLTIAGDGAKFTLQGIPASKVIAFPDAPTTWTDVSELQMSAICAVATAVDMKHVNPAMCALRITPDWVAAAAHDAVVAAWIKGLVSAPFSVLPGVFQGLSGAGAIAVSGGKLWVKDGAGQVRWALGVAHDWPDESVREMVANARAGQDRVVCGADLDALMTLCKRAVAAGATRVEPARLTVGDQLVLETDGRGASGERSFAGHIACDLIKKQSHATAGMVGIAPHRVAQVGRVVSAIAGAKYLSCGNKYDPVLMWGGDGVVMEALMMPVRIPRGSALWWDHEPQASSAAAPET